MLPHAGAYDHGSLSLAYTTVPSVDIERESHRSYTVSYSESCNTQVIARVRTYN